MTTILLVSIEQSLRARIDAALSDVSLFVATDDTSALRQLRSLDIDLVLRPLTTDLPPFAQFLVKAREASPTTVLIAVALSDEEADGADFLIRSNFEPRELKNAVRFALAKATLARELRLVRNISTHPAPESKMPAAPGDSTKLVREFTRMFTASFDLPRTLEMFLDGVNEFLRPARLALLLPDEEGRTYRVRVHRGLLPQIAESVRLPADRGLCQWLAVEGRPARAGDLADVQVARELGLFQGTMAIPLLARGELVAVLVVGPPVVRSGYVTHEVETLFDLATHLAGAIDGISLHHRLQRVHEFNERILEHMSSGVITIGADERVGIMNRRAAEILDLEPQSVVSKDLRVLPSPLGDMLYETLTTGRARPREEIRLAMRGLWLDVSTYAVRGDDTAGAVLVFEDLTAQKELAARKREAEQFDLLGRVVARIADEIRNPLVSINTFMELIGERLDDPDFRRQFGTVVGRDVRRLVQVFEKLSGLVTRGELNFTTVDVHSVIEEAVGTVRPDDGSRKTIDVKLSRDPEPLRVKVDPAQCRKALEYLIWYLAAHSPDQAVVSISVTRREDSEGVDEVRVVVGSRTAAVPAPEAERLFDPVRVAQDTVIDMGPAVSQRIVEALGGKLELRQTRNDLAFIMKLPVAA